MNATTTIRATKSLADVKADMSELYEAVKAGSIDLRTAAEMTNITGKYLKAAHLEMAREIYLSRMTPVLELGS